MSELIYDVGAHCGSDTGHYLALGYRVLAIEADPTIADGLRKRFADAIATDRLTVLQCGVADSDGESAFYLCPSNPEWNSFDKGWAAAHGTQSQEIRVPTRRFESILAEYGTPFFLKVDIEGLDALCVRALSAEQRPQYVSFEAGERDFDLIVHLRSIGYQRFALVDQYTFRAVSIPPIGSVRLVRWSALQAARRLVRRHPLLQRAVKAVRPPLDFSPRGEFRVDSAGPAPMERQSGWQHIEEFAYTWNSVVFAGLLKTSWFDIHAAI